MVLVAHMLNQRIVFVYHNLLVLSFLSLFLTDVISRLFIPPVPFPFIHDHSICRGTGVREGLFRAS